MATRLRDVAELAGVSIRTVSNVVNGYARVSEPKRLRVEAAVAELGYRPNVMARNLKHGRTGLIALVVPELDVAYFAELARAVITAAREHGFTVVVDQTDGEPARERELIGRDGNASMFDGVILSPLSLTQADLAARDASEPLILLGERIAESEFDHVAIDNVAASRAATTHLLELGRRRVAAIGDQPYDTGETAQLRTRGFELAHEDRGLEVDRRLIVPIPRFHYDEGLRAMQQLLASPDGRPDAVFCFNDLVALGAMRAIHLAGLSVPGDIAVVGFDDVEAGRFNTPSLTTIAPDKHAIARLAIERMVARLGDGADDEPAELWAPWNLIVRESSSPGT
jgi:DNA-binding LacI/PurR family transcriptional regulator